MHCISAGKRHHRLAKHCNVGVFLGCAATMKNIIFWDVKTKWIKTALHAAVFDEGMSDLVDPAPNAHRLRQALEANHCRPRRRRRQRRGNSHWRRALPHFSSFWRSRRGQDCLRDDLRLGLDIIENCSARNQAHTYDAEKGSSFSKLRGWKNKHRGAYVVAINGEPAVTVEQMPPPCCWKMPSLILEMDGSSPCHSHPRPRSRQHLP